MKREKKIYLISPNIKWSIFKKLYGIFPDTGPSAKKLSRVLWGMLRETQIYCFFCEGEKDMMVSTKLPKNMKVSIIGNAKPLNSLKDLR